MIIEVKNHDKLIGFYSECGLEFEPSGYVGEPILSLIIGDIENVIAATTVTVQNGNIVLDDLAVKKDYRNNGYGEQILLETLGRIKEFENYDDVFIITKVPGFFRKYGFEPVERSEAPDFSICFQCEQYQKDCFPVPMKLSVSVLK